MYMYHGLVELLIEARIAPQSLDPRRRGAHIDLPAGDLLGWLEAAWRSAARSARSARSARCGARGLDGPSPVRWLQESRGRGAQLTIEPVELGGGGRRRAADGRLAWWPVGRPSGRRVALVSSRIGRALERRSGWFACLRAACGSLVPPQDLLLTGRRTTTDRFVRRWAERLGLPLVELVAPPAADMSLAAWWQKIRSGDGADADAERPTCRVLLSPPLPWAATVLAREASLPNMPARDQALVALADCLFVLHLRPGGNLQRLVRARLASSARRATVHLAVGSELVPERIAAPLLQQGAQTWCPLDAVRGGSKRTSGAPGGARPAATGGRRQRSPAAVLRRLPGVQGWDYLAHCTRRRDGPWPGQDQADYLDGLIFGDPAADHSAFAALVRILTQQRLVASSQSVRGRSRVVSFTAVPLALLPRLRCYRPHRVRWDFQPYGVCIRRAWLERAGARPVRYGDDKLWEVLPADQRPFFQQSASRRGSARRSIDWRVEREWRIVGDLDLAPVPDDAGLVFLPTPAEAEMVTQLSRWPVVVLDHDSGARRRLSF